MSLYPCIFLRCIRYVSTPIPEHTCTSLTQPRCTSYISPPTQSQPSYSDSGGYSEGYSAALQTGVRQLFGRLLSQKLDGNQKAMQTVTGQEADKLFERELGGNLTAIWIAILETIRQVLDRNLTSLSKAIRKLVRRPLWKAIRARIGNGLVSGN